MYVCLSSIMSKVPITGVYYTCDSLIMNKCGNIAKIYQPNTKIT